LREAQALTANTTPHCGLATTIDIGEADKLHPRNKQDVGRRLALSALALTYGKPVEYSGPVFKAMKLEGNSISLEFDHVADGLVAKGHDNRLLGFAICASDKRYVWADARIDGKGVIVSAPQVKNPVAVRYAWANNPVCNLYNSVGLPAVPFRTDRD
jgi:sialate O-acetylesterase